MQPFHLACPFTSLPVCHCRLYEPAPPAFARDPLSAPAPRNENALRRALLLDMVASARAPPGRAHTPPPHLTRALFWRAMRGRLPPLPAAHRLLSHVIRACDLHKEQHLVSVTATAATAKDAVHHARLDLHRLQLRDARRERHVEQLHNAKSNLIRCSPMQSDSDHNPTPTSTHSPSDDSDDDDVTIRKLASTRAARAPRPTRTITRRRRRR